jgi:hypothetical protein
MRLIILSVIIAATFTFIWYLVRMILQRRDEEWSYKMKADNNKVMASLRVPALERLAVMLERITPERMILRLYKGSETAGMLEADIVTAIREEFDHNISLQIYVSEKCWESIVAARKETSELIRVAASRVEPADDAALLCREIMNLENIVGNSAIKAALHQLRQETETHY